MSRIVFFSLVVIGGAVAVSGQGTNVPAGTVTNRPVAPVTNTATNPPASPATNQAVTAVLSNSPAGLVTTNLLVAPVTLVVTNSDELVETGLQLMREQKYAGAAEYLQRAAQARPGSFEIQNQLGIALVQIGRQALSLDQRLQFYQQAAAKFSRAAELNPTNKTTQLFWSDLLMLIGDMPVDGRVRLGCYQGAVMKCQRAAQLDPKDWETLNKWGVILSTKLPDFAVDDNARVQLYKEAAQHFAEAAQSARFSSEIGPLYSNWGSALVRAARLATSPEEKTQLLSDAITKFEASGRALPNYATTYSNWGNALVERGKLSHLRQDFRDGIDRLNTATSLNSKDAAAYYSLARAYAIIGNTVLAIQKLRELKSLEQSGTMLNDATRDPDFATLNQDREFLELISPTGGRGLPFSNPPLRNLPSN